MTNDRVKKDKLLYSALEKEIARQENTINLIASENIAPEGVLEILGSHLTNKYCEGCPGKRYYAGCDYCDDIEELAKKRALQLFKLNGNVWDVNVQPYSGAIANLEIYSALLNKGDKILSMDIASGGHLSHGASASLTSKFFDFYHYGVNGKYEIDYEDIFEKAKKIKPKLIVSGASAYPPKINFSKIGSIAKKIGALHLADISHYAGLIATGNYPSPFRYADIVMTTTHKSLLGPRAAIIFSRKRDDINIRINKAVFPGMQGGPHFNTIGAIAYGLKLANSNEFKNYSRQVVKNSKVLCDVLKKLGAEIISKCDSHMLLMKTVNLGFNGSEAERILEKCDILVNKNMLKGDKSPLKPSAIRIGTYTVTMRGMREKEMEEIGDLIYKILSGKLEYKSAKSEVSKLCKKFPISGKQSYLTKFEV